jgi:serine O-acetyltransferase
MLDALTFYRTAHRLHGIGLCRAARVLTVASRILFSAYVPAEAEIGPGCELGYGGIGIVIHKDARIGRDVLISPGVVIGGRSELRGAPIIEDGARIGAGAKVLGPIRIGARAQVGANAVVLHDVAPGETVAGIPARPIRRSSPRTASNS